MVLTFRSSCRTVLERMCAACLQCAVLRRYVQVQSALGIQNVDAAAESAPVPRFVHVAIGCRSVCVQHAYSVLCCVVTCRCSSRWAIAMLMQLLTVRLCLVEVHAAVAGA